MGIASRGGEADDGGQRAKRTLAADGKVQAGGFEHLVGRRPLWQSREFSMRSKPS